MHIYRRSGLAGMALVCLSLLLRSSSCAQTASTANQPAMPHTKQVHLKHVLVIGQTKGFEHDSVPDAMAAIYKMGHDSGLWDTTLRTDTVLICNTLRAATTSACPAGPKQGPEDLIAVDAKPPGESRPHSIPC